MQNQPPLVRCLRCDGAGYHALSEELWDALKALRRMKKAHAKELGDAISSGVTSNAMNNRLEDLRDMNFVTRERKGRFWIYSPSK